MTSEPSPPASQQGPAARDEARAKSEASSIAAQSPDASLDSAPVSNVAGLKAALLNTDQTWSRDRWFAEDIEVHPGLTAIRAEFPDAVVDAVRFRDETTIHVK